LYKQNESTYRVIYSMRLAGLAMANGFILVSMDENFNGNGKNVFFFKDTPQLARFIDNYKANSCKPNLKG